MTKRILLIDDEGISIKDTKWYLDHYLDYPQIDVKRNCADAIDAIKEAIMFVADKNAEYIPNTRNHSKF